MTQNKMSPQRIVAYDRRLAAIHEAAHQVVARRYGLQDVGAWIEPSPTNEPSLERTWIGHTYFTVFEMRSLSPVNRTMVAVAGFIAEAVWQHHLIEDLDYEDHYIMSDADWRLAGLVPGSPTKQFFRAVDRVEKMFLSGSSPHWKLVMANARKLIIASRSVGTMS
jgi:hypothetical protein